MGERCRKSFVLRFYDLTRPLSDFFGLVRGKRQRNLVKQWEKVPKSEYRCENEDKGL
ncbi:MAG: hypothetical protein N2V75_08505 [Methanophagales archaeon]|nr:hypothetical protein [Methanophagales archaeon]